MIDGLQQLVNLLSEMPLAGKVGQMVGTPPSEDIDELKSEIWNHHVGPIHFGMTPYNTPKAKSELANEA